MKAQDLKNSILQLAVEGKLVPQDPSDEPAGELLARIRKERAELIEQREIRRPKGGESVIYRKGGSWYERRGKGDPVCIDGEIPFDIPESWEWARLSSFAELLRGSGIKRSDIVPEGLPCVRYGELYTTYDLKIDVVASHIGEAIYQSAKKIGPGEVLMTLTGENDIDIGRAVFNNTDDVIAFGGDLIGIRRHHQHAPYLAVAINSSAVGAQRTASATGNIIVHLSVSKVAGFLIPVPPLAEQKRIVEKVDGLMPLVEEYGKLENAREALDAALPDRLRKSVLQLAVEGKLVPQDPSDEPASKLLERIREERAELVKQGKAKRPKGGESVIYREGGSWYERRGKSEPACIDDEIPFDIPESWEWSRFGALLINRDAERIPISVSDREKLNKIYDYYGASGVIDKVDQYLFDKPLLLIGEDGANLVNRSTPIAFIARGKYWVNNHAHVLDGHCELLLVYVSIYINSISLTPYITGTAQPKMNQQRMNSILVPVPPLSEQQRIIEKLDQVMKLIGA